MEGGMPGGAKGGYRSLQLSEGRGHGFEMLIAFDPLPHCDFGNRAARARFRWRRHAQAPRRSR
jgi:hypothetical protein